ncbi:MAG: hypothetical protein A4S14_05760 [Proteobacteria bacterium SG_bin9]|nr:MAG: hypothetical protein A4S14_05760 [Proteobacteria bacterium SG_bin9]
MNARRAHEVAEAAARHSYGRLLALLAARTGDIAAAEDALADAFVAAVQTWPERGVPDNPDAWLLTVARNNLQNKRRSDEVRKASQVELEQVVTSLLDQLEDTLPDRRLNLLFVCAHPAIDPLIRTPLMLQAVLGLDAVRIGAAFLVAPATMGQRLSRAKAKIRDAKLRFETLSSDDVTARLSEVLNAIYISYGAGWDHLALDPDVSGLTGEALFLGRLLVELLPEEPEPLGLLALMLYCEARRDARRDTDGKLVPLNEQNASLWSSDMIAEAEQMLIAASRHQRFGRYQCEAAIQSVHVQRPVTGRIDYDALLTLYDLLVSRAPSIGAHVGRAAVLLDGRSADLALQALNELDGQAIADYQPYWATRARVLGALHANGEASRCLERAIALTRDPSVRIFLERQRQPTE